MNALDSVVELRVDVVKATTARSSAFVSGGGAHCAHCRSHLFSIRLTFTDNRDEEARLAFRR